MTVATTDNPEHTRRANLAAASSGVPNVLWSNVLGRATVSIIVLLSIAVSVVAIGSGTGLIPLPYEMFVLAERMPVVFKAHMISSAFALLLIPAVIAMRRLPDVHRMLGRVLGAFVVIGGLTALPVAIFSHSSLVARAGFFVQGLVWMALLASGIMAIRRGNRARHVSLMLAMAAVTTGAVWFRLMIGLAIYFHLPFEPVYSAAAWIGWLVPLAIVLYFPALTQRLYARSGRLEERESERAK